MQVRQLLQQLPSDPAGTLSQLLVLMAASADNAAGRDGPPPPRADGASATNISVFELLNSGGYRPSSDNQPSTVLSFPACP